MTVPTNLGVISEPPKPGTVVKPTPDEEIDRLTANELPRALEEEKSRTSRFDRQFTDRNWNKRAEMAARNRALTQYQEKYGYNKQPEVMSAFDRNRKVRKIYQRKAVVSGLLQLFLPVGSVLVLLKVLAVCMIL